MIEKFTPDEIYQKRKSPLTQEEKQKMKKDAIELEQKEQERSGSKSPESTIAQWQKEINANIVRDDHDVSK